MDLRCPALVLPAGEERRTKADLATIEWAVAKLNEAVEKHPDAHAVDFVYVITSVMQRARAGPRSGERAGDGGQSLGVGERCGEQPWPAGPALRGTQWVSQPDDKSCYTACLASLTGLAWDGFPKAPEARNVATEIEYLAAIRNHLLAHGWMLVTLGLRAPAGFAIATGLSPRDPALSHCVVVLDGRIVHDPHPSRMAIDLARVNEYEIVVPLVSPDRSGHTYIGPERRRADTPPTHANEPSAPPEPSGSASPRLGVRGTRLGPGMLMIVDERDGWPILDGVDEDEARAFVARYTVRPLGGSAPASGTETIEGWVVGHHVGHGGCPTFFEDKSWIADPSVEPHCIPATLTIRRPTGERGEAE